MLTIINVNYDKNYFTAEVTENGTYQISGKIFDLNQGKYLIHFDYEFIRLLKEKLSFTKTQTKIAKKEPIGAKKAPIKKKVSKKSKKA